MVPGTACTDMLLAVVATKFTVSAAEGVPPGPEAVMVAVPAEAEDTVTAGVSPVALVVEGLPAMAPRLVAKVTAEPTTAAPAFFQLTETAVGVLSGMSVLAVGAVKAKLALLMVSACVVVAPAAVAVMVSLPALVAVMVAVIWPEVLVMPVPGVSATVLPFAEVTVTAVEPSAVPAESLTVKLSVVVDASIKLSQVSR